MATKIDFQLIPLEKISIRPFDLSKLPFSILPNVEVADVSELLPATMFDYLRDEVGRHRMRVFDSDVKHAIVHRYEETHRLPRNEEEQKEQEKTSKMNAELLNEVFACSRIVRPTRRLGSVTGFLNPDGTVDLRQSTFPDNALDVPEALTLFLFETKTLRSCAAYSAPF